MPLAIIMGYFCRESGVRNLQKHIDQIYRKGAMKIVSSPETVISVSPDNLEDFVGKPKVGIIAGGNQRKS